MAEDGVAEALVRERLPRALVRRMVGPPERLPESFIDESLRASVADLVLRCRLRGGRDAYVYCVIEHKRTSERFALLQVLRYLTMAYARLFKERRGARVLPNVVALLVYNGTARWRGPRRFTDLTRPPPSLRRYSLDFEVVLLDVGAVPNARLSRHRTLRAGLLAFKASTVAPQRQPPFIRSVIAALRDDPSTFKTFLSYLGGVAGEDGLPLVEEAMKSQGQEDTMRTINQYLEELGRRKGLRAGLKKGLEQGREEALRLAVGRVLRRRFKKIPATVDEKLAQADAAMLERWLDSAVEARSLRAVFATH
jgi:predicted transposase YdaD